MNVGLNELADLFKGSQLKKSLKKQGVLFFFYISYERCVLVGQMNIVIWKQHWH